MSTANNTERPPCTFTANVEGSGQCFIPDVFASDVQHLAASLDWARVFNTRQQHQLTAAELDAAASAASNIAAMCQRFSTSAREAI